MAAVKLSVTKTLDEAKRLLTEQGLDIGPWVEGISSGATAHAELAAQVMAMELAKLTVKNAAVTKETDYKKAVAGAFDKYKSQVQMAFDTNLRTAYSSGRYFRVRDSEILTHMTLRTMRDKRVRPAHAKLEGTTLPKNDAFWGQHLPPMGYRCRCKAYGIEETDIADLKKSGVKVQLTAPKEKTYTWTNKLTGEKETLPESIDPGWLLNGKVSPVIAPGHTLEQVLKRKKKELMALAGVKSITVPKPKLPDTPPASPAQPPAPTQPALPGIDNWTHEDYIRAGEAITKKLVLPVKGDPPFDVFDDARALYYTLKDKLNKEVGTGAAALIKETRGLTNKDGVKTLTEATQLYPRAWVEAANKQGNLYAKTQKGLRGFAYTNKGLGRDLNVGQPFGTFFMEKNDGVVCAGTGEVKTMVHEYGHRLQSLFPDLDDIFQQLHRARTAKDKLQRLKDITKSNYRPDEVSKPDHYVDAYMGKEYGTRGALEMLTMAMQYVLAGNIRELATLATNDPKMFNLTVGVLFHWKPKS